MNKTLVAIVLMAMIPTALAHTPAGTPNPNCNPFENPHDYSGPASFSVGSVGFGFVSVQDGCAAATSDGDFEFGNGGGFLPASHHGSFVCVTDNVLPLVSFSVGADGDGDGLITNTAPDSLVSGSGCVTGGAAGADGGWWVFVDSPATAGHISA